jgi:hypothetical protein
MDFPIQVIRRVAVISWNFVLYQPENAHRIMWRKANRAQTQWDLPSGCVTRFLGSAIQPIHVPKAYSDSTTTTNTATSMAVEVSLQPISE